MRSLFRLGLLAVLAAGCVHRSVIARQSIPGECTLSPGRILVLNRGIIWWTPSEGVMREWLSRIDSADVQSMEVLTGPAGSAIYGIRGADGVVAVTLKRGSASERRFSVPPPPVCQIPKHAPVAPEISGRVRIH